MSHPYSNLSSDKYWRKGVAEREVKTLENFYTKRFDISKQDKVATAGSCFAQHLARHMRKKSFTILDVERPVAGMSIKTAQKYGFLTYSARYGNVYTSRQLRQLVCDAFSHSKKKPNVRAEDFFEKDGRFYDGLRPSVEPHGLATLEEAMNSRTEHLNKVRGMLRRADVFVFTFGLTETWENRETGIVYPVCPGVVAGEFSDEKYRFLNLTHAECYKDFEFVMRRLKKVNPDIRFLITVSPVPLTATASGNHVLTATTYSKSVLRGVCGEIVQNFNFVDYFPSYEIITSSLSKAAFFEENLRSVREEGVETVMHHFFSQHDPDSANRIDPVEKARKKKSSKIMTDDGLICEERLLDAFS